MASNAWFSVDIAKIQSEKWQMVSIFLALSSVVRISELAGLDDIFAEQDGSVQLQEVVTFILSQLLPTSIPSVHLSIRSSKAAFR